VSLAPLEKDSMQPEADRVLLYVALADAASELLCAVSGEMTVSWRLVFGIASLPLGSPVELEVILEVKGA
jgi:hypothetical protein